MVVATGVASTRGLLVKGGDVLERAARTTEVLLDKTGTVTRGRPALGEVVALDAALGRDGALALTAAVERRSEHHVGRAIVEAAKLLPAKAEPRIASFRAVPGKGVVAQLDPDRDVTTPDPDPDRDHAPRPRSRQPRPIIALPPRLTSRASGGTGRHRPSPRAEPFARSCPWRTSSASRPPRPAVRCAPRGSPWRS
jgi:Cu2+-exporting ATPase